MSNHGDNPFLMFAYYMTMPVVMYIKERPLLLAALSFGSGVGAGFVFWG